jgi:leucyl-tRNA synthetase
MYLFVHFRSLLDGLDDPVLENWRDIINLQRHWIGECNGTTFEFELEDNSSQDTKQTLTIFTTNPEYICNAAFIAVAPGNILDRMEFGCDSTVNSNNVFKRLSVQAKNPFTRESLPIYVTDQVEYDEGTDCHLGIPGISETDRLFAEAANIPISSLKENDKQINSVGDVNLAREHIIRVAWERGIGGYPCSSKLRDWLISRQRYWGTPTQIVYCEHCNGPQPVPYSELPVILPKVDKLSSRGKSPLLEATDWLITKCPKYVIAI